MSLDFGKPDKEKEELEVKATSRKLFWEKVWLYFTALFLKSSRTILRNRRKAISDTSVDKAKEALQKRIASKRNLRREPKESVVTINLDKKE